MEVYFVTEAFEKLFEKSQSSCYILIPTNQMRKLNMRRNSKASENNGARALIILNIQILCGIVYKLIFLFVRLVCDYATY